MRRVVKLLCSKESEFLDVFCAFVLDSAAILLGSPCCLRDP